MKKSMVGIFVLAILVIATSAPHATEALTATQAYPSNNIVNTKAWYEISFHVGTTATIERVEMTFPAGTNIANAALIERSGIAAGSTTKTGQTITYTVANPVSVASNAIIRLEYDNILNPPTANPSLTVLVTTKDFGGGTIESGTSLAYAIKQIETGDIANGAITSSCGVFCASKLADNAVISPKIADGAVTSPKIATYAVEASEIAPNAVGTSKIADQSIGSIDIGANGVGSSEIADQGVGTSEIADQSIGSIDIGANAVGSSKIADQSIGSIDIGANAVGSSEIKGVDKLLFGFCNINWGTFTPDDLEEVKCPFPGAAQGDLVLVTQGFIDSDDIFVQRVDAGNGVVRIAAQSTADVSVHDPSTAIYSIMVYHIG